MFEGMLLIVFIAWLLLVCLYKWGLPSVGLMPWINLRIPQPKMDPLQGIPLPPSKTPTLPPGHPPTHSVRAPLNIPPQNRKNR